MEIENFRRILIYDESKLCLELAKGQFYRIRRWNAHPNSGGTPDHLAGAVLRTELSDG